MFSIYAGTQVSIFFERLFFFFILKWSYKTSSQYLSALLDPMALFLCNVENALFWLIWLLCVVRTYVRTYGFNIVIIII